MGERIEFIQALRGIAAMGVVLFHARIWIMGSKYGNAGELFRNGAAGVDLFFVVSGFIMVQSTWALRGGGRDAFRFFAKRFARIWPVYIVDTIIFVTVTGTLGYWFTTHEGLVGMGKTIVFYPINPSAPPFFDNTPNGVGWTLIYEMWFYVLFAISLLFGTRRWIALAVLFAGCLVVLPLATGALPSPSAYAFYDLPCGLLNLAAAPLVWEFLAGVAIGVLYRSHLAIRSRWITGVLVTVSIAAVLVQQLSRWDGHGLTGWGPMLILLVLALALRDRQASIRVPRWLVWLGDVSFSLYLVHLIAQHLVARALRPGILLVVLSTILALVLAQLSYRYLERGLAERFRRWLV